MGVAENDGVNPWDGGQLGHDILFRFFLFEARVRAHDHQVGSFGAQAGERGSSAALPLTKR